MQEGKKPNKFKASDLIVGDFAKTTLSKDRGKFMEITKIKEDCVLFGKEGLYDIEIWTPIECISKIKRL